MYSALFQPFQLGRFTVSNRIAMVAVGRVLLSDPEWPHKIRCGDLASIAPFTREALATLA